MRCAARDLAGRAQFKPVEKGGSVLACCLVGNERARLPLHSPSETLGWKFQVWDAGVYGLRGCGAMESMERVSEEIGLLLTGKDEVFPGQLL